MFFRERIQPFFCIGLALLYAFAVINDYKIFFEDTVYKVTGFNGSRTFGWKFKYLTYLDLNIQAFYFILSAVDVLIRFFNKKENSGLKNLCNVIYCSLTFPVGAIVTILFWSVYAVDRNLIYPEILEKAIPAYQNHLVHTLPLIGAAIDNFLTKHNYDRPLWKGTVVFLAGYLIWICFVAYKSGNWVYPILKVLTESQRILFFCMCAFLGIFIYKLGEMINRISWSEIKVNPMSRKKE